MVRLVQTPSNIYPSQQFSHPKSQSNPKLSPFQNLVPDIANQIFHHVIALDAGHAPINARNWLLTCHAFATSDSRVDLHRIDKMFADKTFTDNCLQHKNQDIASFAQIIKQIHPVKDLSFNELKMAAFGQRIEHSEGAKT